MYRNPARQLHNALETMISTGGSFRSQLEAVKLDDEDLRTTHTRLLGMLASCENIARATNKWERNSTLFSLVWEQLMLVNSDWGTYGTTLNEGWMSSLWNLADSFDSLSLLPISLEPEQIDGIRIALEKMQDILNANSQIPEQIRGHLLYLIHRALDILAGEDVDLIARPSISLEILSTTIGAYDYVDNQRDAFTECAKTFFNTWLVPIMIGTVSNLLSNGVSDVFLRLMPAN